MKNSLHVSVIGIGVGDQAYLDSNARQALSKAEIIWGADRQLKMIEAYLHEGQRCQLLPKLSDLKAFIEKSAAAKQVICASGDPLFYGIGRWALAALSEHQVHIFPNVSSIQVACARLGLSLPSVEVVSLHGRPLQSLRRFLSLGKPICLLTDANSTPAKLSNYLGHLALVGRLDVCEQLGTSNERVRSFELPCDLSGVQVDPLHISFLHVQSNQAAAEYCPGLPDAAFETGRPNGQGMITKREVRLQVVSALSLSNNMTVWDVGAGCGSVSLESALAVPESKLYAIEHHVERLIYLKRNLAQWGLNKQVGVIEGTAPEALETLPRPDRVFVGGSGGRMSEILDACWMRLPIGGLLVATSVTSESASALHAFIDQLVDVEWEAVEIGISRFGSNYPTPEMKKTVTLWRLCKRNST